VRAVVECAGIHDVLSKCIGTNNPLNVIHATMVALKQLRSREQVAFKRGMTVEQLAEGM
jgi:small subunit ribosomal protein S5